MCDDTIRTAGIEDAPNIPDPSEFEDGDDLATDDTGDIVSDPFDVEEA